MNKPQIVMFDFDGTIADSYEFVLGFLRRKAGRKQTVSVHEEMNLRGYPMHQMARKLGMPWWRMPFLFFEGRRAMASLIDSVELFPGMDEAIRQLHARGDQLFIVSSNSEENIREFLRRYELEQYFTAISGGAGLTNKWKFIRSILTLHNLENEPAWYVGDEGRDIRAAHAARVQSVAVTWGYNNAAMLHRRKPTKVAFEPAELTGVIE